MSTRTMFVVLTNAQWCTEVKAVAGGQVCFIAPNYIRIYDEEVTDLADANSHCHAIEVPEGDIKEQAEGDEVHLYLWKGPHEIRLNELDTSTLPISVACGQCSPGAEAGEKKETKHKKIPADVEFAALVLKMSDKKLDAWPNMGETSIQEWKDRANGIVDAHADKNKKK